MAVLEKRQGLTMKELKAVYTSYTSVMALVVLIAGVCYCDTFTNTQTKETLHGYTVGQPENGQINVNTQEKGILKLNPNEWKIARDKLGRTNKVLVLPVENPIMFEIETIAFEQALAAEANGGPLLILVEIDTPGGRVDLAQRMCTAITNTNCDIIAFVKGGPNGGAISAGAAVALACDKIYMANNTVIGAATLVNITKAGAKDQGKDKSYKDVIDEKHSSVWRAYLASLAQHNDKPGLLARAMVDSSIDIIEVNQAGKREFIEPVNKKPEQQVIRTWNKSGSLVTLTAEEAVGCTIADGLVSSREELLQKLQAGDANIVIDKRIANARKEIQFALRKRDELLKDFDLKVKQTNYPQTAQKFLGILRGAKEDFETLKTMAQKYPDLHMDIQSIESELNTINATYENVLRESRSKK
jgi:membrane-bound ClpP family serine protease